MKKRDHVQWLLMIMAHPPWFVTMKGKCIQYVRIDFYRKKNIETTTKHPILCSSINNMWGKTPDNHQQASGTCWGKRGFWVGYIGCEMHEKPKKKITLTKWVNSKRCGLNRWASLSDPPPPLVHGGLNWGPSPPDPPFVRHGLNRGASPRTPPPLVHGGLNRGPSPPDPPLYAMA